MKTKEEKDMFQREEIVDTGCSKPSEPEIKTQGQEQDNKIEDHVL